MAKINDNEVDIEKQIEKVKSENNKNKSSIHLSTDSQKKSSASSTPIGYCRKVEKGLIDPKLCAYTNRKSLIDISFENLSLSVKLGSLCKPKGRKNILKNLNGKFESQDLAAIIGPSGAGKSSLLNLLAGYKEQASVGDVYINGTLRDIKQFRKIACYIMQDDCLMPYLTVEEAMMVCANLKMSGFLSKTIKKEMIGEILEMLGLLDCRAVLTRNLSGGQRKRLAIGLELVNNPPIMFLDEPTSGLDSYNSFQVISLLKVLAHDGRAIICSIHQPSAKLFELFDQIYILSAGQCIYNGNIPGLVPFFKTCGLECPRYHNPADFAIEVASGEHGDVVQDLVKAVQLGKCEEITLANPQILNHCPVNQDSSIHKSSRMNGFSCERHRLPESAVQCEYFNASNFKQFQVLFWRMSLSSFRDPTLTHMRFASHVSVAVILGLLYLNIGNKSERVLNNTGFLFFCILFIMFAALMPVILSIPLEMPIFVREHLNFWYTVDSYFLARTAADIPYQIIFPLIYSTIVYFMSGQPQEIERFAIFVLVFILISLDAQAFGLLIGAASPSPEMASFAGPITMIPLTLFSGFFVRFETIPWYMKWISYASYMRYGFRAVLVSIYGNNRAPLECNDLSGISCGFQNTTRILIEMDVKVTDPWLDITVLAGFFVAVRILCYIVFRIRVKLEM